MCNKVLLKFFHPRGFLSDSISCIFLEEVSESHIVSPLSPQKRNEILWFDNRSVFLYFLDLTTRRIDLEIETFLKLNLSRILIQTNNFEGEKVFHSHVFSDPRRETIIAFTSSAGRSRHENWEQRINFSKFSLSRCITHKIIGTKKNKAGVIKKKL